MGPPATQQPLTAKQLHAITRALADPTRFAILQRVAAGDQASACSALRECFPIAPATLSHHLKELEASGLVETAKRGRFVDVRFCRQVWNSYLATLKKL